MKIEKKRCQRGSVSFLRRTFFGKFSSIVPGLVELFCGADEKVGYRMIFVTLSRAMNHLPLLQLLSLSIFIYIEIFISCPAAAA